MHNQSTANRYREVAIKTATPLQLIVILYEAAINALQEARERIDRGDIAGRSRCINKSIAIISELQACLNLKEGGEIASSLDSLYDYMKHRLFKANVEQSVNPLSETESLLENLSSAWKQLVNETHNVKIKRRNHAASKLNVLDAEASPTLRLKSLNISG